jgi:hypothetical protein
LLPIAQVGAKKSAIHQHYFRNASLKPAIQPDKPAIPPDKHCRNMIAAKFAALLLVIRSRTATLAAT